MAEIPEDIKKKLLEAGKARRERMARMTQEEKEEYQSYLEEVEAFLYPATKRKKDQQEK